MSKLTLNMYFAMLKKKKDNEDIKKSIKQMYIK